MGVFKFELGLIQPDIDLVAPEIICPSAEGATLYITLSPCRDCSKLIHQAGIVRVVYRDEYKDTSGLDFLKSANVEAEQISI